MADYGHDLLFGAFITPSSADPQQPVRLTQHCEQAGLDLATFQDHPYQPAFLDTWTLMSYAAAGTDRIRLTANVHNLPLRPPAVLARSAASLDRLSGGRVELGLGAGAFWDAIAAMGGPRLAPRESITALGEAIEVIRAIWDADNRERLRFDGQHYQLDGAKRGPKPTHPIAIWVGGYRPRMLRLIGTQADGWLPSLSYVTGGLPELAEANATIDQAALAAGRQLSAVRRLINIDGEFRAQPTDRLLVGPPEQWVDQLAGLALEQGFSGFILTGDDPQALTTLGRDVAPRVRELVADERGRRAG